MNIIGCNLFRPMAKNFMLIGAFALSTSLISCNRERSYKELNKEDVPIEFKEAIDSFVHENKDIPENPNFVKYGEDTLRFEKFYLYDTPRFRRDLEKMAQKNMPKTCVGSKKDLVPIFNGKTVVLRAKKRNIYEYHYVNNKAVVVSDKLFTQRGRDIHIPIQFYGEPNPKLK